MAALAARLAAQGARVTVPGGYRAAPPAPVSRRRSSHSAHALAPAEFSDGGGDALGALASGEQSASVGAFATAALRLAAGVLAGIPASVALDEVADREGQRVRALTNAVTADGVRLYAAFPASVHSGEPAPIVVLVHQVRHARCATFAAAQHGSCGRGAPHGAESPPVPAVGPVAVPTPRGPASPSGALTRHPPQFFGLRERETALCDELARLGCVAIAPDVFQGRSTAWVPRALTLVGRATLGASGDWGAADLASVVRWIEQQPWGADARLGIAGFCFGGGAALRFAEAHPGEVDAVASFYGAPLTDAGRLNCPVFAVYGTADAQFPPAVVDRFEKHLSGTHVDATVLRFEVRCATRWSCLAMRTTHAVLRRLRRGSRTRS